MRKLSLSLTALLFLSLSTKAQMPNPFGLPPIQYTGNEMIHLTVETSEETIRRLVPAPMVPMPGNKIFIDVGRLNASDIMEYNEMYVSIPVTVNGKMGIYIPILYLDKAAPIVAGREVIGFPKVEASIHFDLSDEQVEATVIRNGVTVLQLSATLKPALLEDFQPEDGYSFVIKEIPASDGSDIPEVRRLNSSTMKQQSIYGLQPCQDIELTVNPSASNFMPELAIVKVVEAVKVKLDGILDYGEVEYDYLRAGDGKRLVHEGALTEGN